MVIVGGVLVVVAALVAILTSNGGSSPGGKTSSISTANDQAPVRHTTTHAKRTSTEASRPATSRAETHVVVLNGTETSNLAHDVSGELRQSGYSQATPLAGRPPGANGVTVVEYAPGHRADAQGVARSLSVSRVQPLESATAALASSATVVVVVGADRASSAGGGGESSGTATAAP